MFAVVTMLGSPASATEARIAFQGPSGEPARLVRAELLLAVWGTAERIPLDIDGNTVRLDLSASSRPAWAQGYADFRAYLYAEAEGYAPIRSEAFDWLHPPEAVHATLDFREGRAVTVREGDSVTVTVKLRRPVPRRLHFVDESGRPMRNLRIATYMFWSHSNHCGALSGAVPLGIATTDTGGRITIPDGDFEYALELQEELIRFVRPRGEYWPRQSIAVLPSVETTLPVHRYQRRPLRLDVRRTGKPASGARLMAQVAHCGCGICFGAIAASDAMGRVRIPEFYPEQWDELWLCDGEEEIWRAPVNMVAATPIAIELARGTGPQLAQTGRCPREPEK